MRIHRDIKELPSGVLGMKAVKVAYIVMER